MKDSPEELEKHTWATFIFALTLQFIMFTTCIYVFAYTVYELQR